MNKVMIRKGDSTVEFDVPYALARAIETMLNHTDYPSGETDNEFYDKKGNETSEQK